MRVVVTGAGGFVGSALIESLREQGIDIVALSTKSSCEVLDVTFKQLSSCDTGEFAKSFKGADAVVHLIGRSHVLKDKAVNRQAGF